MPRLCPVCQSSDTGGYPKRHKDYTSRGRLDIDDWVCIACGARWEIHDYVREDTTENHNIRLKDGRSWTPESGVQGDVPQCPYCKSIEIEFVQSDGRWHRGGANILRYECDSCRAIWQWYINDDGKKIFKRKWR
jgi:C4-type Zn-finger protein